MLKNQAKYQIRISKLEEENERLRRELDFLRAHPAISQGMRGELLIIKNFNGAATSYTASHDFITETGIKVEIKYSKLNQPNKRSPTKRWNWGKPLGWLDKGKDYDFLLLIGEKDHRYAVDFLDKSPYVYFLLPIVAVPEVMSKGVSVGGMIQITTNLPKLRQKKFPPQLLKFQSAFESLKDLLGSASST
ncbi:hypothetical protein JAO85_19005 [Comamonas sp. NyZ500]|uniref:hypothetical protein n=1 Tax=Comamonas sp. NyZ500 TaxID=2795732 RepID=UPI00192AEDD6|nr:hypothetical protein [Comamonas sp. NyZ500]MBL5979371.1 hypothetical protein [Comamonas sp. NyZ500]